MNNGEDNKKQPVFNRVAKTQIFANIATVILCAVTIFLLILAYKEIDLAYRPIVYIRASNIVKPNTVSRNFSDYSLTLVNVGKLEATQVKIDLAYTIIEVTSKPDAKLDKPSHQDDYRTLPFLKNITLYPGQEINFWLPEYSETNLEIHTIEVGFNISYFKGEKEKGKRVSDEMYFIFKQGEGWIPVSPKRYFDTAR